MKKIHIVALVGLMITAAYLIYPRFSSASFYYCPAECQSDNSCIENNLYCPEACYYGDLHPEICHPRFDCPSSICPFLTADPWARH